MNKYFNLLIVALVLFGLADICQASPGVSFVIPKITFTTEISEANTVLNELFTTDPVIIQAKNDIEQFINRVMSQFASQELLAKGFANANAYSAQSGTLQGYQGYKLFALMGGVMIGAQIPSIDRAILEAIPVKIAKKPDVYAGIAPSLSFNIGLNAGGFLGLFNKNLEKKLTPFYFNIKYGRLNQSTQIQGYGDIAINSTNFGIGGNYQWKPQTNAILFSLFKWRGVSFGTGINYQSNCIQFYSDLQRIDQAFVANIPITDGVYDKQTPLSAIFTVSPTVNLGIDIYTLSIPLEASTSIQFLWFFNLNLGAGGDVVFGSTAITANANSSFSIEDLSIDNVKLASSDYTIIPGAVKLDAGTTDVPPCLARIRLMAGIGAQLGPLKVDIPVYYYLNSGFAAGLSAGIVW